MGEREELLAERVLFPTYLQRPEFLRRSFPTLGLFLNSLCIAFFAVMGPQQSCCRSDNWSEQHIVHTTPRFDATEAKERK